MASTACWTRPTRGSSSSGLPFSVHGPFLDFEYGSRSASAPQGAGRVRRHIAAAAELGARVYVVHPDLQRRWRGWDRRVQRALEQSFDELAALQEESGVTIAVENLPFVRHTHFKAPGDLDLRGLGLSLDVGHAAVTGTLAAWLEDDHHELKHIHLHDNEGHVGGDQHLPLGRGVVAAAPILKLAREHRATVVLEHKNEADVMESLRHLEERGLIRRAVR